VGSVHLIRHVVLDQVKIATVARRPLAGGQMRSSTAIAVSRGVMRGLVGKRTSRRT
jgi:hypothetical protein